MREKADYIGSEATSDIEGVRKLRDEILDKVRKAANEQGRVVSHRMLTTRIRFADTLKRCSGRSCTMFPV